MKNNKYADVGDATRMVSAGAITNTYEELQRASKVICGARACRGPEDAKIVLEALGLLDPKGKKNG